MPFSQVLRRTLRNPSGVAAALALAVRAATSAQAFARNPVVHSPQLDGMYYLQWAREIAAGDVFGTGGLVGGAPLFLNPLYAYIIAPIAAVMPNHVIAGVLALQVLLGAATAALAAAAADRFFGRVAAFTAGIAVAPSTALVQLDGHLSVSGLGAFLVAGAVFSAAPRCVANRGGAESGAAARGGAHGPVASGLWLGLGALARPIAPLAVPFFAWLHARRAAPGHRLRAALLVVAVFAAPAALSFARNVAVGGEGVVYTAASGANIYLGNGPAARKYRTMSSGGRFRFSPFDMHDDARRYMASRLGIDASWSEISAAFTNDTLEDAAEHPAAALAFLAQKARWFVSSMEVPSSASLEVDRELVPLLRAAVVPTWLLAALGLLGLVLHARRRDVLLGPGSLVLAHVAVLTLVFPLSHYRSPAIPALAVLSGGAVAWGVAAWRARRHRALALGAVAVAALAGLGALPPQPARQRHTGMFVLAACYRDAGQMDQAEAWVRRAGAEFRAAWPDEPDVVAYWSILGDVYFSRGGRFDRALDCYRRVLDREPYDAGIRLNVVVCLMALDRWQQSLAELQQLVQLDASQERNPAVLARFAEALTRLGRAGEARPYVIEALRLAGDDPRERPRAFAIPLDLR